MTVIDVCACVWVRVCVCVNLPLDELAMVKLKFPEALKVYEELEDNKLPQRVSCLRSRGIGGENWFLN